MGQRVDVEVRPAEVVPHEIVALQQGGVDLAGRDRKVVVEADRIVAKPCEHGVEDELDEVVLVIQEAVRVWRVRQAVVVRKLRRADDT